MITKAEKTKLKILLKGNYTEDVLLILDKKNITSKLNEPYSSDMVRIIFNGVRENKEIEDAIFELYESRKKSIAKQKQVRKNILQKKP